MRGLMPRERILLTEELELSADDMLIVGQLVLRGLLVYSGERCEQCGQPSCDCAGAWLLDWWETTPLGELALRLDGAARSLVAA